MSDNTGIRESLRYGSRKFYDLDAPETVKEDACLQTDSSALFRYIEQSVIGHEKVFSGPWGLRKGR